jgi:hypothetical protein
MTHQKNNTGIELALEEIMSNDFESAVSFLVNGALKVDRSRASMRTGVRSASPEVVTIRPPGHARENLLKKIKPSPFKIARI